jgi:hypothetical protein
MKNLWPQPDEPRPELAEKNHLENELRAEVCAGTLLLTGDIDICATGV